MKKRKSASQRFVVCIDNTDYLVSLELHKIYEVLPDERADEYDCIRVIDESGEEYLYSSESFVPIELPEKVIASMNRGVRESTVATVKSAQLALSKSRVQRKSIPQRSSRAGRG